MQHTHVAIFAPVLLAVSVDTCHSRRTIEPKPCHALHAFRPKPVQALPAEQQWRNGQQGEQHSCQHDGGTHKNG